MFFERSRFFRDNDMSALVFILRKEQYCMFVLYIRMFVGDRLNIIVTSVNIPSKCSYLILLHSWSRVSKIFEWVACYQEKSVPFVAAVVVVFFCRRSSVNFCWVEFRFKLRDWACSKFAIIPLHSTIQYTLFAYNLIIGRCKTASQNQLERIRNGIKIGCMAILSGPWF